MVNDAARNWLNGLKGIAANCRRMATEATENSRSASDPLLKEMHLRRADDNMKAAMAIEEECAALEAKMSPSRV